MFGDKRNENKTPAESSLCERFLTFIKTPFNRQRCHKAQALLQQRNIRYL